VIELNYENVVLATIGLLFLIFFITISQKDFKFIVFLVLLTPVIRSLFGNNQPVWINEELETGLPGYLRGFILLLGGLIGIIYVFRSILLKKLIIPLQFFLMLLFIIFSIGSTFYSINPSITLNRSILFLMIYLLILGIYQRIEKKEDINYILSTIFYSVSFIIVLSIISLAFPARSWWWQSPSRFIGYFSEPNGMGSFLMISFPFLLWKFYFNAEGALKKIIPFMIIIIFLLLVLTGSRTSIITSVIGLSLWYFMIKKRTKLLIFGFITSLIIMLFLLIHPPESIMRGDDSITTTTGRDVIWGSAVIMIMKNPWLGYGYLVESKIWQNQYWIALEDWITVSSQQPLHNGYLSIIVGNGIIGFILWVVIIITPLYIALRIKDKYFIYHKALITVFVIMVLITNFFESFLTGYLTVGDTYFWFMWMLAIGLLKFTELNEVIYEKTIYY